MGTAPPCPALLESLAGPVPPSSPAIPASWVVHCQLWLSWVCPHLTGGRILPKECGLAYNCIRTRRGNYWVGSAFFTLLTGIFLGLWCSRALGDSMRCFVWKAKTWHPMLSGMNLISKSDSELALGHLYFSDFLSISCYQKEFWFHCERDLSVATIIALFHLSIHLSINHVSSSFCVSGTVLGFVGHKWTWFVLKIFEINGVYHMGKITQLRVS